MFEKEVLTSSIAQSGCCYCSEEEAQAQVFYFGRMNGHKKFLSTQYVLHETKQGLSACAGSPLQSPAAQLWDHWD